MNVRGIMLLRCLGLPGPDREVLFTDPATVDLDRLYDGAPSGADLYVFDGRQPLVQSQEKERDIRQYRVPRRDFFSVLERIAAEFRRQDVPPEAMICMAHQDYSPATIAFCGKAYLFDTLGIFEGERDLITFSVDAAAGLRKANADFSHDTHYVREWSGVTLLNAGFTVNRAGFPESLVHRIRRDLAPLWWGHPVIDFEVYRDGRLFYHDLSFGKPLDFDALGAQQLRTLLLQR